MLGAKKSPLLGWLWALARSLGMWVRRELGGSVPECWGEFWCPRKMSPLCGSEFSICKGEDGPRVSNGHFCLRHFWILIRGGCGPPYSCVSTLRIRTPPRAEVASPGLAQGVALRTCRGRSPCPGSLWAEATESPWGLSGGSASPPGPPAKQAASAQQQERQTAQKQSACQIAGAEKPFFFRNNFGGEKKRLTLFQRNGCISGE